MSTFGGRAVGDLCPCGAGAPYDASCGPFHRGEVVAETAEGLMRSRYAASTRQDAAYLLATWNPSTRPASLVFDPGLTWLRLEVLDSQQGASGDGEVEFRAHYRRGRVLGSLHERSRFTRRGGRWLYLDGEVT